jgi:hypothetical protein
MTVQTEWQILFEPEQIQRLEGESFARILARPRGREEWAAALAEAKELVRPAAIWDFLPVREILHEQVVLNGGLRIGGGHLGAVVGGASELMIAVCTIGPVISERVRELQRGRQMLRGILLDSLGSWAVEVLRQQLCRRLEAEAAAAGQHLSTCMSPGDSGWSLQDQRTIFTLVDAARIGVSLSPSLVMLPLKSLSLVMGRGSVPMGHEGGSNCDFCAIRDRCAYRNWRETLAGKGNQ